jgi:predicted phage gp36 major capsid-like protein
MTTWRTRQESIDKRIAVVRAYSAVLTEVADTHADLKKVFAGGTTVAAEPCLEECETDKQTLTEANREFELHARALEPLVKNLEQALQSVKQIS